MQPNLFPSDNTLHEGHFRPVAEVLALLDTLRSVGISWMADEIEQSIQSGRLITREYAEVRARKLKSGYTTIPFSEVEQLQIALETIRNYFVILFQVWQQGQQGLKASVENPALEIVIAEIESNERIRLFSVEYGEQIQALDHLINNTLRTISQQQD